MDLLTIPIMIKHVCDSISCITQTDYITITDIDLFIVGINCFYGYLIARAYLNSKKHIDKITGESR